jgi:hypothetical protein
VVGTDDTDRFVTELGKAVLVRVGFAGHEREAVAQAAGGIRLRELQGPAPEGDDEHRVGSFLICAR